MNDPVTLRLLVVIDGKVAWDIDRKVRNLSLELVNETMTLPEVAVRGWRQTVLTGEHTITIDWMDVDR